MGVGEGNGRRLIHGNSHGFYAGIYLPVGIIHGQLFGIQGARLQVCDGNGAVVGRGERRTGYCIGTGSVKVKADFPTAQILAGVGFLYQLNASGFQLVIETDRSGTTCRNGNLLRIGAGTGIQSIDTAVVVADLFDIIGTGR